MKNRTLNTTLNTTADLIEHTSLGRFVFYGVLLTAPLGTSIAITDIAFPDVDPTTTEQSTQDRQTYTEQIAALQQKYDRAKRLDDAIPNQQGTDAVLAMQERQNELYTVVRNQSIALEADVLTDPDLTESDFQSIAGEYNSFAGQNLHRYLQGSRAGFLEECRAPAISTDTGKTNQANATEQCLNEKGPDVPLWMFILGLPIFSYLGLLRTGWKNIDYNTNIADKTAKFLRKKAESPKSH